MSASALTAVLALGILSSVAPPASAATVAPRIIGGQKQPSNPWVYQLGSIDRPSGDISGCTSEALDDHWVLTAKHCVLKVPTDAASGVQAAEDLFVVRSNDTALFLTPSHQEKIDQVTVFSDGDLALIHTKTSNGLSSYPTIASNYTPDSSNKGLIQGYGLRKTGDEYCPADFPSEQADWLYQAGVSVTGKSSDAFGGEAVHVQGIDGITSHGDSGGPLTLSGATTQIVGVASTIDGENCANDIHWKANYANVTLAAPRAWITSVTGH